MIDATYFNFFFYEVSNPNPDLSCVSQCFRVEGKDSDRYQRYFISFWFELQRVSDIDDLMINLLDLESGRSQVAQFGGDEWNVVVRSDFVVFSSINFEEWNDGFDNVFSYSQFKALLLAWRAFLSMEFNQVFDVEYVFKVPEDGLLPVTSNDIYLVPVRKNSDL